MKLKFNHNFGQQEQGEFFHFGCELIDVAPEEFNVALEMGFLQTIRNNQVMWYQSRSTRVITSATDYQTLDNACILQDPTPAQFTDRKSVV